MTFPTQVPDAGTPIFDAAGYINPVWHQFFFTMLNRTGGTAGAEPVTDVIGSPPITSTGGGKPIIGITPATPSFAGSMSAEDKTKLDTVSAGAKVSSVTGTSPILSSGGATPNISISAASPTDPGSMSASDKAKLDTISANAAVASVSGVSPISSTGGASPAISISPATTIAAGSLSASDKTKLDLLTYATGTWVPQITFTNPGDLSVTYLEQSGTYTRIGRMIFINFSVRTSTFSFTTATGSLIVNGVPFPSNAGTEINGTLSFAGIAKPGFTSFTSYLANGASVLNVLAASSGSGRFLVDSTNTPTGGTVFLSGTVAYFV